MWVPNLFKESKKTAASYIRRYSYTIYNILFHIGIFLIYIVPMPWRKTILFFFFTKKYYVRYLGGTRYYNIYSTYTTYKV